MKTSYLAQRNVVLSLNAAHQAAQLLPPEQQTEIRAAMLGIISAVSKLDKRVAELAMTMALAMHQLDMNPKP